MLARKFLAEVIGTFTLCFMGCGTAMLVGCDAASGGGYILTALAFGLSIVAMAYSIGNITGCHINPAVSLAVFLRKGLKPVEFLFYVIAQIIGAVAGVSLIALIFQMGNVTDMTGGFGSNGLGGVNGSFGAGFLLEVVLTFLFVTAILGVTSDKFKHGSFGGLIIGLTLTFVHLVGIGLTGCSVNPARSLGSAIVAAASGNSDPMGCVIVFIIAPLVGAAIAAVFYNYLEKE